MAGPIVTSLEGGVFRITLNRPEVHNAFNEDLIEALRQAVERAAAERDAHAVLLQGAGPSFCAGADVSWMKEMGAASADDNRRSAQRMARLFLALSRLEKPLLGRIHGAVVGGGVGLAAVCDVALAGSRSWFALSEVRLGLIPAVVAPYLIRKVGPGRARELILTGRRFDAQEAAALGLVTRALDESLLDPALERILLDLKAGGPQAQAHAKRLLQELEERPRAGAELADWTAQLIASVRAGEEARAGLKAFLEKTPPPWAGGGAPAP